MKREGYKELMRRLHVYGAIMTFKNHVLRDCTKVKSSWLSIVNSNYIRLIRSSNVDSSSVVY